MPSYLITSPDFGVQLLATLSQVKDSVGTRTIVSPGTITAGQVAIQEFDGTQYKTITALSHSYNIANGGAVDNALPSLFVYEELQSAKMVVAPPGGFAATLKTIKDAKGDYVNASPGWGNQKLVIYNGVNLVTVAGASIASAVVATYAS